jgi:hypothetical protein
MTLSIIRQSVPTQRTVQYDSGFSYCKIIIFYILLLRKNSPLNPGRSQVIKCTWHIYYLQSYMYTAYEFFNSILTFFFLFSNNSIHSGVLAVSSIFNVTQYNYLCHTQIAVILLPTLRAHTHGHTTWRFQNPDHRVYTTHVPCLPIPRHGLRIVLSTTCAQCSPQTLAPLTLMHISMVHFHPWSTGWGDLWAFDGVTAKVQTAFVKYLIAY